MSGGEIAALIMAVLAIATFVVGRIADKRKESKSRIDYYRTIASTSVETALKAQNEAIETLREQVKVCETDKLEMRKEMHSMRTELRDLRNKVNGTGGL